MFIRVISVALLAASSFVHASDQPLVSASASAATATVRQQPESLRSTLERGRQMLVGLANGTLQRPKSATLVDLPALAPSVVPQSSFLPGTWRASVPGDTPEGDFFALQTFGADGTFVETSSLLGTLVEGPAHGVWAANRGNVTLTFELFAFADDGTAVGKIRIRAQILMRGRDRFLANTAVDLLPLDDVPLIGIGGGPFTAERMPLLGN